jgi:hypothetical protein
MFPGSPELKPSVTGLHVPPAFAPAKQAGWSRRVICCVSLVPTAASLCAPKRWPMPTGERDGD